MSRIVTALAATVILTLIPTTAASAEPYIRWMHPEYSAAHSTEARDMRGIEPSLYKGKWHNPRLEPFRRCVMTRESHGNYRAANPVSSARGAYQFLDRQWRDGLVWMMLAESRKTGDRLEPQIRALRDKPIHKWSRYWQDRAFWTALRHGDGAHHWHYGGSTCNGLA